MTKNLKRIVSVMLALLLVFGMYPGISARAEGEAEQEAEQSATLQAYWNASDAYWLAQETFWAKWEAYYGNEETGVAGALNKYNEATLDNVEKLHTAAVAAHDEIGPAYELLPDLYNAVKTAYNALTEEEKADASVNEDYGFLKQGYGDATASYENDLEEPEPLALRTFWIAVGVYWDDATVAFDTSVGNYYGNEETGVVGVLNEYYSALEANKDESAIQSLYEEALSVRETIIANYDSLTEVYGKVAANYETLESELPETLANDSSIAESYNDIVSAYADVEKCIADVENDIPDSPAPLFYDNASTEFWNAIDAYWKVADAYAGDTEKGIVGVLNEYENARSVAKDIPAIIKLYEEAKAAKGSVDTAYADLTTCYNNAVTKYNALSTEAKDSVEDYNEIVADYANVKKAYNDLDAPAELKVAAAPTVSVSADSTSVTLKETTAEILGKIDLTEKEKKAIAEGAETEIAMAVKVVTPTTAENDLIAGKLGDYTAGSYLDIGLTLKIGENSREITGLTGAVNVTVTVPDTLLNKDATKQRDYCIIRVHNGAADVLEATFTDGTVTFATDRFSVYTLAYKDTLLTPATTPAATENTTPTTTATGVSPATTDDSNPMMIWIVLFAVGLLACSQYIVRKKNK